MLIKIKIITRDKNNPKKIVGGFLKVNLKKLLKPRLKSMTSQSRTKRKFTTLISPHVHKDAQTSFEVNLYKHILTLNPKQISKILSYYTRFFNKLIPNSLIKITLKTGKCAVKLNRLNFFKSFLNTKSFVLTDYLTILNFLGKKTFDNFLV